jgi:hypothetical protein
LRFCTQTINVGKVLNQVLASARYEAGARRFNTTSRMIVPGSNYAVFDLGGVIPIRTGLTVRGGVFHIFAFFEDLSCKDLPIRRKKTLSKHLLR